MAKSRTTESPINIGRLLEFVEIFPDEKRLNPEQYLKGGSRDIILNAASFFLGFKSRDSKYEDNKEVLTTIFGQDNNLFANKVYERIKDIEKQGREVGIINPYSSLKLFEQFFQLDEGENTQTSSEFEINIFKAYLVYNSEFAKAQLIPIASTRHLNFDLKIPMICFCMFYPIVDKVNYTINQVWITQTIKAIYLFQFLESDKRTKPLLAAFVAHFNSNNWKEYLKNLLPLTLSAITGNREAHTDINIPPGELFAQSCAFVEKLIVSEKDELNENDFLTLRSKPFYKVGEGVYRVIFNLFVVEKIFKGVYFFLRDINAQLPEEQMVTELKSLIGYEFCEKILLYEVLNIIYPGNGVKFSGNEMDTKKIDGAPDYYVRKGKSIMLFESKDFLIRADKKMSFDFEVYEPEFERVLYFERLSNGKEKHKAVMQLINNIRKILKNEFPLDKDYYYKEVFIYPILITHDLQFDAPGFNTLINDWFQSELQILKEEGLYINHVKPLVIVNIDFLIYYQVGLRENCPLHEVLKQYEEYIYINPNLKFETVEELEQYRLSKLTPFSLFLERSFNKQGFRKLPPILDLVDTALLF